MAAKPTMVEFVECPHCKNNVQMIVLCEGGYAEDWEEVPGEYTDCLWRILECPYCSDLSVIKYYRHSINRGAIYTDDGPQENWPYHKRFYIPIFRLPLNPQPICLTM